MLLITSLMCDILCVVKQNIGTHCLLQLLLLAFAVLPDTLNFS